MAADPGRPPAHLPGMLAVLMLGASSVVLAGTTADAVFLHGTVIPMTGAGDHAEAVAVKEGRILAVGSDAEIAKLRGPRTEMVDLAGKTLLPGFIDAHGHLYGQSLQFGFVQLSPPPVGKITDIAGLQAALRAAAAEQPEGWLLASGYDDAELREHRHPTRQELDAVASERPIIAFHASYHLATLNTKALEHFGFLHPAQLGSGTVVRLEADGKTASGVLEEKAVLAVISQLPRRTREVEMRHLREAQELYARNGLTTAQEGVTLPDQWPVLQEAASNGALFLDLHVLALATAPWPDLTALPFGQPYAKHLRVAGVKLFTDGSPQGRTAWLSHPYSVPPSGRPAEYAGYPQFKDADLESTLANAAAHGWQVYVHANGDAAIQQLIDAVRAVDARSAKPLQRTIVLHAQTARVDQLQAMVSLDMQPSFFAAHTFYWGDWHREVVLGPVRADHISPQRTAFDVGLRPTIHNDTPAVPPDMIRLLWSAVTRRTMSNDILGPSERVSTYEALEEVTSNAAWEIHEETLKGTLQPGKLADFVILSANPLAVAPDHLLDIRVEGTIKEGKFIYRRSDDGEPCPRSGCAERP